MYFNVSRLRSAMALGGLASSLALTAATPALAMTDDCVSVDGLTSADCVRPDAGLIVATPVAANTEAGAVDVGPMGFSIEIDGETIAGDDREDSAGSATSVQRQDIALERAQIDVRTDGIRVSRQLNVQTHDLRTEFRGGETVRFRSSSNYPDAIERAEVRITPLNKRYAGRKTIIVPIDPSGTVAWEMPTGEPLDYSYVLRVYDAKGRFDETVPEAIARRDRPVDPELNGPVIAAGEAEDRTAISNIPVQGGLVTISGSDLPAGSRVLVLGKPVPVDEDGRFVTQRVLPAGAQNVTIDLDAPGARPTRLMRYVDVPRDDWFMTGLADFTFGRRGTSISDGESFSTGRLAFYGKGVVNGDTRVTVAFDSGEDDIDNLFDGILDKDPRAVLDRIDASDLYPTYGDDSTILEDAPTSGKVYLKLEKGDSHLMWGDFEGRVEGSGLLASSRDLYGAQGVYRSPATTSTGERRLTFSAYAAQPESRPQRDELRGTGGSVYFLKRQDIQPNSETVTVEVVDRVTGRVLSQRLLNAGQDFRIDYLQGKIILNDPLAGSSSNGSVINGGAVGSANVNLVVQYEYAPSFSVADGSAVGGRFEAWLPGDVVRLGVTAMDEATDTADVTAMAADVRYQLGEISYVEAEVVQSRGTGYGRSVSTDGGLTFFDKAGSGSATTANAVRVEGEIDLQEVGVRRAGRLGFFYHRKEAGFTTLSEDVDADERHFGFDLDMQLAKDASLTLSYSDFDADGGEKKRDARAEVELGLDPATKLRFGIAHLEQFVPGDPEDSGRRTDAGLRMTRDLGADQELYAFAQATLDRSGTIRRNDRIGLGGSVNLTERLSLAAEVSDGTTGVGAQALFNYRPNSFTHYYAGYELEPGREIEGTTLSGSDRGAFILGTERKVNDALSYTAERSYDMFGHRKSLTDAYGVTYTPGERWSYAGNVEVGRVEDEFNGDFDRVALSFGTKYDDGDGGQGRIRVEYIKDDHETDASRDRETFALVGAYSHRVNDNWRFVANLDALVSESDQSDLLDGRYVEASVGYAYRPVDNDRLNLLARYTFLYDLPGVDQVASDGSSSGSRQKSHIVSLDAIYEANANWELGGKLAYRVGETAPRSGGVFTKNDAGLAAIRATYSIDQMWEVSAEGRVLVQPHVDTRQTGTLLTVYRSFGNNAKIGLGYNFGSFSDDLRDTTQDDKGIFLNVQAKF